jgi:hypothetical protein
MAIERGAPGAETVSIEKIIKTETNRIN